MAASPVTTVTIDDKLYRKVTEGKATILAPFKEDKKVTKKAPAQPNNNIPRNNDEGTQAVFYNPIQQYNRDLSVLAIKVYGESAIELKRSRRKRNEGKHERRKERKQQSKAINESEVNGTTASKKRKADDAELETESEAKRRSIDDDEDLEVQQLAGAVLTNTTAATSTNTTSAPGIGARHNSTIEVVASVAMPTKTAAPPSFTILDALSASGLRAIRYAKEIPFATTIVANDMLPEAVEAIKLNITHNELSNVTPNTGDAKQYMYSKCGDVASTIHKFDVVDLDPYGTAAPFIDAALQSLTDGGLLAVTCTDAGVWASNGYPEKAFALYNGTTLKGPHSHEAGLRLILHSIASTAAKYGIAIEPLLCLSIDFYARCFIRVHKSQQEVKLLAGTTMVVHNCDNGCGAWRTQMIGRNSTKTSKNGDEYFKHGYAQSAGEVHCEHCGNKTHVGGPMWAGPLHNPVFVQKILDQLPVADKTVYGTTERIKGMLTVALEEEELEWKPAAAKASKGATESEQFLKSAQQSFSDEQRTNTEHSASVQSSIIPRMPPQLLSPSPFFFIPGFLSRILSMSTPAEDPLRGALLGLGYSCTRSHCKPGSFKTNAPWSVIWEVMRENIRQLDAERIPRLLGEGEFSDKRSVKPGTAGYVILKKLRGRNGNTGSVMHIKEDLLRKLGFGQSGVDIESADDLKAILQAALYTIDHPNVANGDDAEAAKGEPTKITGKALIEAGGDPSELEIVFDAKLGKAFKERGEKVVRYQQNPRAHWGPMVRAGNS